MPWKRCRRAIKFNAKGVFPFLFRVATGKMEIRLEFIMKSDKCQSSRYDYDSDYDQSASNNLLLDMLPIALQTRFLPIFITKLSDSGFRFSSIYIFLAPFRSSTSVLPLFSQDDKASNLYLESFFLFILMDHWAFTSHYGVLRRHSDLNSSL